MGNLHTLSTLVQRFDLLRHNLNQFKNQEYLRKALDNLEDTIGGVLPSESECDVDYERGVATFGALDKKYLAVFEIFWGEETFEGELTLLQEINRGYLRLESASFDMDGKLFGYEDEQGPLLLSESSGRLVLNWVLEMSEPYYLAMGKIIPKLNLFPESSK